MIFSLIISILTIVGYVIYFTLLFGFKIRLDFILNISRLSLVFYWLAKVAELFVFKN